MRMSTYNHFTKEQIEEAVVISHSYMGVLRALGVKQTGGSHSHYKRKILAFGMDTSHFTGQSHCKGNVSKARKAAKDILVLRLSGGRQRHRLLARALIESGVKHECAECGQPPIWRGKKLTLDVDHIDENWLDDRRENLRFLCPNCHSQFSRNLGA